MTDLCPVCNNNEDGWCIAYGKEVDFIKPDNFCYHYEKDKMTFTIKEVLKQSSSFKKEIINMLIDSIIIQNTIKD